MRKQYHFWPAQRGFDAWDVDRLIELSRGLPVERVAIDSIREIDTAYWFGGSADVPTVRKVAEHAKLIAEVDTAYPIILGHDGRVMDGMHRIAAGHFGRPAGDRRSALPGADRTGLSQLPAARAALLTALDERRGGVRGGNARGASLRASTP